MRILLNQGRIVPLKSSKFDRINPNKEELTVEKLRQFPGMENLSDERANKIVITLNAVATVLYNISKRSTNNGAYFVDNQEIVNLNNDNKAA